MLQPGLVNATKEEPVLSEQLHLYRAVCTTVSECHPNRMSLVEATSLREAAMVADGGPVRKLPYGFEVLDGTGCRFVAVLDGPRWRFAVEPRCMQCQCFMDLQKAHVGFKMCERCETKGVCWKCDLYT